MESIAIIGMIFGMAALKFVLQAQKDIKVLEQRIEKLESEMSKSN